MGGAAVPTPDGGNGEGGRLSQENLQFNLVRLITYVDAGRLDWGRSDDLNLYKFVRDFYEEHQEVPTLTVVRDHFKKTDELEVDRRLEVIETATPYARSQFHHLLEGICGEQGKLQAVALLKKASDIFYGHEGSLAASRVHLRQQVPPHVLAPLKRRQLK